MRALFGMMICCCMLTACNDEKTAKASGNSGKVNQPGQAKLKLSKQPKQAPAKRRLSFRQMLQSRGNMLNKK